MSIEFHCDHCGKLVRTADEHAGKRGKCPTCHQSVYIPSPRDELETLGFAEESEEERAEKERAQRESDQLAAQLRGETADVPDDNIGLADGPDASIYDASLPVDMEELVVDYVLAMADGNLDEAESLAHHIKAKRNEANDVIERLSIDEIPPRRLARVPRPLLQGFLRQLQSNE